MAQKFDTNKWYSDDAIDEILTLEGKTDDEVQGWWECISEVPAHAYVEYANNYLTEISASFRVTEAHEVDLDNDELAEDGTESYFEWKITTAQRDSKK